MVKKIRKKIRLNFQCGLIFLFFLVACVEKNDQQTFSIVWKGEKAIAVQIDPVPKLSANSGFSDIQLFLKESNSPVLGNFQKKEGRLLFTPIIPFTRGLNYTVIVDQKSIGSFTIPPVDPAQAPEITTVYPAGDTLPSNLLKWYLVFSRPMQEGEAINHIHLIRNQRDTLTDIFMDLSQELWNKEGTVLTLWMDPGRIKRGLQPNLLLGPPMLPNETYELFIDSSWRDGQGAALKKSYRKSFRTSMPDTVSPDIRLWKTRLPALGTTNPLSIDFPESLDHVLLENAIQILNEKNEIVRGKNSVNKQGTAFEFIPELPWKKGKYLIRLESRLEDLAGNNLNRLFDQEIYTNVEKKEKEFFELSFELK